ncbi:MAG: glycosyltransferase family 4 protein [Acidimicrobiales bacterium]
MRIDERSSEGSAPHDQAVPARQRRPLRLTVYLDSTEMGGAEQSAATLLASLGPHVRATVLGVDPDVVRQVAAARPGTPGSVLPVVTTKVNGAGVLAHLQALRAERPEVLHLNLNHPWSCLYAALAARVTGTPTVGVVHSDFPPAGWSHRWVLPALARRFASHVAVSESVARAREAWLGLAPGTVRVIYNGVLDVVPAVPPTAGASYDRSSDHPLIGAIGRLAVEKGFDLALEALTLVPMARLLLVGDGGERARLEGLAATLGVADRVIFTGWADNARDLLQGCDLLVAPSRVEGCSLVAIEAMLGGLPVVATRVGGIPEVVVDGETALLVPPEDPVALADAIVLLLADPELRLRMGCRGRERALAMFSPEAMARSFEEIYDHARRAAGPATLKSALGKDEGPGMGRIGARSPRASLPPVPGPSARRRP